jgi:hypothetical protein
MRSGNVDASSIASLSAALNIGVDTSAVAIEAEHEGRAVAVKAQLAAASLESHKTVERMTADLFERHEFDADVARHTHGAELEAFKRREAEDEKYIREQSARHTPEGDLNASGKMQGYMLDANAHGAGDDPDFLKKWNELKENTDRLRDSMRAAGKSTEEYEKHIREDIVTFLATKGLSDAQIKDALAKNDDPLDAVKPYLGSDQESQSLADHIGLSHRSQYSTSTSVSKADVTGERRLAIDTDSMNARLAAAGLDMPGTAEPAGHGLLIQKASKNSDAIVR